MKKIFLLILGVSLFSFTSQAQETASTSNLAGSLGLYVFPAKGQSAATQSSDEAACYSWAKEQTGYDPVNPTKVVPAQASAAPDGRMIVGGAKGSAAGAAIGAIAGNAGEGAAIGAVVGGLAGRRARFASAEQEQQQNDQAATEANQKNATDFNNAFTACMEGKGYTVK
jgi:uncharacterized protein YcfJ